MLNEQLQCAIAEAAGIGHQRDLQVLQCSSAGATGAIILHAWAGRERHPRLVVKTPREPGVHHAVSREWTEINRLREDARLAALIPTPSSRFRVDGAEFYCYAGVPGRTMSACFRNRLIASRSHTLQRFAAQALETAVAVHRTHSRLAAPAEVAGDLMADLAWLQTCIKPFPADLANRTHAHVKVIAASGLSLPFGRVHGDFSPYNLMVRSNGRGSVIRLIDWEHTEAERPQHLDIFRFISTCALMARRGADRKAAFEAMMGADNPLLESLFRPWFERVGAPDLAHRMQPRDLQALWWHYCVHAARREQERRPRPADYSDSTFLRSLIALGAN